MRTLVLEALAAWLALAAVCGQACVATENGTGSAPTMSSPRGSEISAKSGIAVNGDVAPPPSALKRQPAFSQREAGVPQRVVFAVNRDSGQMKEVRIVRIDDSETAKFNSVTNAKPVSRTGLPVPEPGSWGTALAGLLGVIAIARRRMSL
jgi:PEP-CTERM motif-containing protein